MSLINAVLDDDVEKVKALQELKDEKDIFGFSALELARFLKRHAILKILSDRKPVSIKVQLKDENQVKLISEEHFKEQFGVSYHSTVTFDSYDDLKNTIRNCPYFFKMQWIFGKRDSKELYYLNLLLSGLKAKVLVKWVDDVKGYGLFADANIPEGGFIGEYAGLVRQIDKQNPELNAYCFQYPTKLFSFKYFVVDALKEGNLLKFINHSNTPNLEPLWILDRGLLHLVLMAKEPIEKDTELTFNYGIRHVKTLHPSIRT